MYKNSFIVFRCSFGVWLFISFGIVFEFVLELGLTTLHHQVSLYLLYKVVCLSENRIISSFFFFWFLPFSLSLMVTDEWNYQYRDWLGGLFPPASLPTLSLFYVRVGLWAKLFKRFVKPNKSGQKKKKVIYWIDEKHLSIIRKHTIHFYSVRITSFKMNLPIQQHCGSPNYSSCQFTYD